MKKITKEAIKNIFQNEETDKIVESMVILLNLLNHHAYYTNPFVWKDIIDGNLPYSANDADVAYKFYLGSHEYRYYSCFEHANGNVIFSFSFSIDGSEACEKDFVQILTLLEKEIESTHHN